MSLMCTGSSFIVTKQRLFNFQVCADFLLRKSVHSAQQRFQRIQRSLFERLAHGVRYGLFQYGCLRVVVNRPQFVHCHRHHRLYRVVDFAALVAVSCQRRDVLAWPAVRVHCFAFVWSRQRAAVSCWYLCCHDDFTLF